MEVSFFNAKNGSETCSVNGISIHSSYDPQKEASRFIDNLTVDFTPKYVLITEPALSYTAEPLRKRFPKAILLALRYCHDFDKENSEWDKVYYIENSSNFENIIFEELGEEGLLNCFFIAWPASAKSFELENKNAWLAIKNVVQKSRSVLATRSFFAQRWLKNCCRFFIYSNKVAQIKKTNIPVVIAASGPSLKSSIKYLKQNRNSFFLIALSSAISPLLYNDIIPDLFFSTDGGYYAKRHLQIIEKNIKAKNIPIGISAEAACPTKILKTQPILPLSYQDFPDKDFFSFFQMPWNKSFRNGTVSGTAIQFALNFTTGNIYCCGLDMAEAKGFQHMQPNALEIEKQINDNRIYNEDTRLVGAELPNEAMKIYREWFISQKKDFYNRVKRISSSYKFKNQLGNIIDMDWKDFSEPKCVSSSVFNFTQLEKSIKSRKEKLTLLIEKLSETEEWLHNSFPADYLCWKRSNDQVQKELYLNNLKLKNTDLINQIKRLLND